MKLKLSVFIAGFLIWGLGTSCSAPCSWATKSFSKKCEKDDDSSSGDEEPATEPGSSAKQPISHGKPVPVPDTPTKEVTEYVEGAGHGLMRLTPEQMSATLSSKMGSSFIYYNPYFGRDVDYFVALYGVTLGGIDFVTANVRDSSTKAQTLLVARMIAWNLARDTVGTELGKAEGDRLLFTECDMGADRPFIASLDEERSASEQQSIREGESRWAKQVEHLFWALYARPPSENEISAVKSAFTKSALAEPGSPVGFNGAWMTVLYAMYAAEEFWNI